MIIYIIEPEETTANRSTNVSYFDLVVKKRGDGQYDVIKDRCNISSCIIDRIELNGRIEDLIDL